MTYLITQILLCLLIAFLLGLLFGYLLCKMCCKNKTVYVADNHHDDHEVDTAYDDGVDDDAYEEAGSESTDFVSDYAEAEDDSVQISLDTNVDLDASEYDIQTLEGVGPQTAGLFRGYGIETVGDYLRKLHKPSSREAAAKDLNILVKPLHDWASMADLLRVEGIGHQQAELTYATGITTVAALAEANAAELVTEMEAVNSAGKQVIAPTVPAIDEVNDWIARARGMSPVITV